MNSELLSDAIQAKIAGLQESEATEYHLYCKLAPLARTPEDKTVLEEIAAQEKKHYEFWKRYTGRDFSPNPWKAWKYLFLVKILGISFGIKLMEHQETLVQEDYADIIGAIPEAKSIADEEVEHERRLLGLINETHFRYIGSIVLGLNDALVELTGALAGLTLALSNTRLIAMTGLITGIAAALSMGASEYLSIKAEKGSQPLRASFYTGLTYLLTVLILVAPYFVFQNYYFALISTLINAVVIILAFTFYASVAQNTPFRKRFAEMASLSFGVTLITFTIGFLVKRFWGIAI